MGNTLLDSYHEKLTQSLYRFLAHPIADLEKEFGQSYRDDANYILNLLATAYPQQDTASWVFESFLEFNKTILLEEDHFKKTGKYSAKPEQFSEIKEAIYDNKDVMQGYYLTGLIASYFSWPHHYALLNYFRHCFLDKSQPHSLIEFGIGHGLFSALALEHWRTLTITGCDISASSTQYAETILRTIESKATIDFILGDALTLALPTVDRIICCELLEHVPEPDKLLTVIHQHLVPGGRAFLTGAINSAQPDHLYLFKSEKEITSMVEQAGFHILDTKPFVHPNRQNTDLAPTVLGLLIERN